MERLTEKHFNGEGYYMKCSEGCHAPQDCIDCEALDKLVDRLGFFEDTGFEPEEIRMMNGNVDYIISKLSGFTIARVLELIDAEVAGRLVALPCKVGDTVHIIWGKEIVEAVVCCIRPFIHENHTEFRGSAICTMEDPFFNDGRLMKHEIFIVFGFDAFLTREEAEAALKGGADE